ncbi:hypothetical protein HNY73_006266 [Argiope bruennichi]|uniref:Uncharacterized protein n=1 Tax=Argiope bruennichi TaxID=94029 RepID=A0A8T0FP37_ARGBR|nr:hypothetical protein HNY73_006266 [Argiope bruennichi]
MNRLNLLSLLLAIAFVLIASFSQTEVQAAIPMSRRLLDAAARRGNFHSLRGTLHLTEAFPESHSIDRLGFTERSEETPDQISPPVHICINPVFLLSGE